jgi:hypothetical protein
VYYNINVRGVFQHENFQHSSLFETAMRREQAEKFRVLIEKNVNEPFLDLLLWKSMKGRVDPHSRQAIGIKGGKGRAGLGSGHVPDRLEYTPANLEDYIGGDAKNYERNRAVFAGATTVFEIGRERSTNNQRLVGN